MDLNLGLLRGISQAARLDRDRKYKIEQDQQEQSRREKSDFLGMLEAVGNHPNMPDSTKSLAYKLMLSVSADPKISSKDFPSMQYALWNSTKRTVPTTEQRAADAMQRQVQSAAPSMDAMFGGMGSQASEVLGQQAARLPSDERYGLLNRDEIPQPTQPTRVQRTIQEGPDGFYSFEDGKPIGFEPYRTPQTAPTARLTEGDKDREEAYAFYAADHKLTVDQVKADPKLRVQAERAYADATGRTPKPPSPYMMSEPMLPVWDESIGQVVYTPRSQAAGRPAPRTTFDMAGNPTTGGTPGVSLAPPPTVPAELQQQLAGMDTLEKQLDDAEPLIRAVKTGPISGRISKLRVNQLGGYKGTPQEIEMVVRLRRLLSSQAFAEGGKQLTGTEKGEFEAIVPKPEDTVEQALIKLDLTRKFVKTKRASTMRYMPTRLKGQIAPTTVAPSTSTPPPTSTADPLGILKP